MFAYDPAAARRDLDAAGWRDPDGAAFARGAKPDSPSDLLVAEDEPLRLRMAQDVARDLAAIGIAVQVKSLPLVTFVERLSRAQFDAFIGQWTPDLGGDMTPIWHSTSTHLHNYVGFDDPHRRQLDDPHAARAGYGGTGAGIDRLPAPRLPAQPYCSCSRIRVSS